MYILVCNSYNIMICNYIHIMCKYMIRSDKIMTQWYIMVTSNAIHRLYDLITDGIEVMVGWVWDNAYTYIIIYVCNIWIHRQFTRINL